MATVRRAVVLWLALCAAVCLFGQADEPPSDKWTVRLLAPLSTQFSRKGDIVSAQVMEPAKFLGSILEGDVHEVKAGPKSSYIQFDIHTLHTKDKTSAVSALLVAATNSREQSAVDEEGSALECGGRAKLHIGTKAGNVSLAPGSQLTLQIQFRKAR